MNNMQSANQKVPLNLMDLDAKALRELIASAEKRLKEVEEEQRKQAISQIRELAASTGLKVQIGGIGKTSGSLKSGQKTDDRKKFTHPNDPKLVYYVNRGRKPQWVRDLEAQGVTPS